MRFEFVTSALVVFGGACSSPASAPDGHAGGLVKLTRQDAQTSDPIQAVVVDPAQTLWVSVGPSEGQTAVRARPNGGSWEARDAGLDAKAHVYELTLDDSGGVLASDAGRLWQFIAGRWQVAYGAVGTCFSPLRVSAGGAGWMYGVCEYYPITLQIPLATPMQANIGAVGHVVGDIWAFGPQDVYTIGVDRLVGVSHFGGGDWAADSSWTTITTPDLGGRKLRDLWSPAPGTLIAVGEGGLILRRTPAGEWFLDAAPTTANLTSVWGSGGRALAVGEHGTVIAFDGTAWIDVSDAAVTANLSSVRGRPDGPIAIGGDDGVLLDATWQ